MELYKAVDLEIRVNPRYTLKNLNFTISDKEITIIYSPSLESLKILESLSYKNKPLSGSLFYGEDDLSSFSKSNLEEWRIKDVQCISSNDYLFDELSIRENIYLPLTLNRIEEDTEYMDGLIDELDLVDILDDRMDSISKIDYYKVLIARSMSLKPFVLLLENIDEELNKAEVDYFMDLITHLNNIYKTTIVISTKNSELLSLGSKKIVIEDGTIKNV